MSKKNKRKAENKIQVKIVYDNFTNAQTGKKYPYMETVEVTEERLNEILELEKKTGKHLIEVMSETTIENETGEDIDDNGDITNADDENIGGEDNNDAE